MFITIMLTIFTISMIQCVPKKTVKEPIAIEILSDYYKNKYIDKTIVLDEKHRMILDTVVMRLTETGEPEPVIQYIVNDFKIKYGKR